MKFKFKLCRDQLDFIILISNFQLLQIKYTQLNKKIGESFMAFVFLIKVCALIYILIFALNRVVHPKIFLSVKPDSQLRRVSYRHFFRAG